MEAPHAILPRKGLGMALFALDRPDHCLLRGDSWIFGPEAPYEKAGDVGNVTFPCGYTIAAVAIVSLLVLVVLGALGAWTGGASLWKGALRVAFWGILAMALTYAVGALFGTVAG